MHIYILKIEKSKENIQLKLFPAKNFGIILLYIGGTPNYFFTLII